MTEAERRRNPRVPVRGPADLTVGNVVHHGQLRDICRDAVLVELRQRLPEGSAVFVSTALPDVNGRVEAEGTVVRLCPGEDEGGHGVAVLFTKIAGECVFLIEVFLSNQARG